ncbi:LOW QUALITY PROTEIN: hypothetical protein MAR_029123 [Mya arenaria]|uniref:Uncharacterized protein n=1 Tax=Mya arenaria TaxID=6604 RepID=A0ABY7DK18_MYAAR|nr:LOW QUALITY PROTEIN: hypothetical protein MAR_029123 [Mya arenaria]
MSRADGLRTFKNAYRVVDNALETPQENGDRQRSHVNAILQFQFIVTLVTTKHILSNLVGLTAVLSGGHGSVGGNRTNEGGLTDVST